jgi:hypothetical protein
MPHFGDGNDAGPGSFLKNPGGASQPRAAGTDNQDITAFGRGNFQHIIQISEVSGVSVQRYRRPNKRPVKLKKKL